MGSAGGTCRLARGHVACKYRREENELGGWISWLNSSAFVVPDLFQEARASGSPPGAGQVGQEGRCRWPGP